MSFQYPVKPWVDGQEIKIDFHGKEVVIAKYDASKNLWTHLRVNDAGDFKYVTSCDVIINRDCSDPCIPNIEWENITNLQTALDYLYYWLFDESNGAIPRLDRLEDKVEELEDIYNELLQIINNLGGLQNLENLLITLQQIIARLDELEDRIEDLELNWRDRAHIVSASPPTKHPDFGDDPLKVGDLWIDNNKIMHYWDGSTWVEVLDSEHYTNDGRYVLKTGDTMTGTLEIANEGNATNLDFDPDKANLTFTTTKTDGSDSKSVSIYQNGLNSSLSITGGVVADGSYFSESGKYLGADPNGQYFAARSPRLQLEKLEGTLQWNNSIRLKWDEFSVEIPKPVEDNANRDGFIIRGTTANGYETDDPLDEDGKLLSVYHNNGKADAVNYEGKIVNDPNLVNKGYVDARDEILQQEIIELEEEIDAIAPSTQRGEWHFDKDKSFPDPGDYYLLKGASGLNPEATEFYNEADGVVFHNVDAKGVINTWANVAVDELIQIFDKPDPDFVLGTIKEIDTSRVPNSIWIRFARERAEGSPNNNPDIKVSRLNIFEAPSGGGTASEFVLKTGDTMTGSLAIDRSTGTADVAAGLTLTGERSDANNSAATIKFANAKNASSPGYLTYRSSGSSSWFRFDQDVDLNSKGLHTVKQIRMNPNGYIGSGSKERIIIRDGNTNNAGVAIQRPGENMRTFSIAGKPKGSGTSVDTFFFAYANSGSGGDAINYTGKITDNDHIVNKKYVDTKVGATMKSGTSTSPTLATGEMYLNTNTYTIYVGK